MARGGKRRGSGRKPKPAGAKKVAVLVRVAPEIRHRLERDARRKKRSLSREIEIALADSIDVGWPADKQTKALTYVIHEVAKFLHVMERRAGSRQFDWRTNRFDFEAFKYAIMRLLDRLAPPGTAKGGHYVEYKTPKIAGKAAMDIVAGLMTVPAAKSYARAEHRGADKSNMFYGFPQAAEALNFHATKARKGKP